MSLLLPVRSFFRKDPAHAATRNARVAGVPWNEEHVQMHDDLASRRAVIALLHKAHVLNIKGRSYRLRDLEHALTASNA
ncbi:MAG: hypothetical protein ACXW2I_13995 [Burkholderiales bacterium]